AFAGPPLAARARDEEAEMDARLARMRQARAAPDAARAVKRPRKRPHADVEKAPEAPPAVDVKAAPTEVEPPVVEPAPVAEKPVAPTPDLMPLGNPDPAKLSAAVLAETNRVRAAHGLAPLAPHAILDRAALGHATRMAEADFFDHYDPDPKRRTPTDRVRAAGGRKPVPAENIITEMSFPYEGGAPLYVVDRAAGAFARTPDGPAIPRHTYKTFAQSIVQRWMDSPGHRANLLDKEAREMGAAAAFFWNDGFPALTAVQVFQRYRSLDE
ncbi:MAG: hypothetical protein KC620_23830, partial [Myxococcales bacterium]|nr:hypothetical protein [Myxococcales bacterium]